MDRLTDQVIAQIAYDLQRYDDAQMSRAEEELWLDWLHAIGHIEAMPVRVRDRAKTRRRA